jgi:hypothetical protein
MSLRLSTRFAAYVRKEQMPVFWQTTCVFLGSGAQRAILSLATGAQRRNLADNWANLSVRDQIPPLRKAAPHSGRNDKMHPCFSRRTIAVFLRKERSPDLSGRQSQSLLCDTFNRLESENPKLLAHRTLNPAVPPNSQRQAYPSLII